MHLLGAGPLVDRQGTADFSGRCQSLHLGGYSKFPGGRPDPLHSYMGLAGLSLIGHPDLQPLDPALNISQRASGDLFLRRDKLPLLAPPSDLES